MYDQKAIINVTIIFMFVTIGASRVKTENPSNDLALSLKKTPGICSSQHAIPNLIPDSYGTSVGQNWPFPGCFEPRYESFMQIISEN